MNVALIEDHKMFAEVLKNVLSSHAGIKEIKIFPSGEKFVNRVDSWKPKLIISDILMPGQNGAELIKAYKESAGEAVKIIILSSISNIQTIKYVIKQGANGYLNKEESLEELTIAINSVMEGEQYISKSIRNKLINNLLSEDKTVYHLSPREKDVLKLVCSGRIMKEIAAELNLSLNTVQGYHKNIMHKFNVKRTSDLIVIAIQNGFYNPEIEDSI